jgi:uncharacterized protein
VLRIGSARFRQESSGLSPAAAGRGAFSARDLRAPSRRTSGHSQPNTANLERDLPTKQERIGVSLRPGHQRAAWCEQSRVRRAAAGVRLQPGAGGPGQPDAMSRGSRAVLGILSAYKRFLSPLLPRACRFEPTCSIYAREAVEKHGLTRGAKLAAWRLLRCHPLSRGGFDPVP